MTSTRATSAAFAAAFFCLPLSKPATFAALGVAMVLLALGWLRERGTVERRLPPWAGAIAVLALLPVASIALHPDGTANLRYLSLGYLWLLPFAVFAGARRADVTTWLAAFLGGTALAWIHLRLESIGVTLLPARPAALGNYILTSQFLALGMVAAAVLHRHDPRPLARAAYWVIAAAMAWGVATGEGRTGAVVALALMPLVASALLPRRGLAVVVAACAIGAAALLASPTVQTRIERAVHDVALWRTGDDRALAERGDGLQNSIGLRLEMWRTAGRVFAEHPIAGAGPQAFQRAWWERFPARDVRFAEPHSAYLFYAAAYGLPGVLALVAFVAALLRTGWRHRARLAGAVTLGFGLMVAIAGLTNTLILGTTSTQMLMLFAGLAGALWRVDRPGAPR
jgi:O-antigen ligase